MADLHFDRRVERAADEVPHAVEQRADVDRADGEVLPAGEGEQALDQGSRAARGLQAGVDQALRVAVGLQPPPQQVEVADHRRQQIVEIVRDAAGQLAERLQLLRFVQLGERELVIAGALLDPRLQRFIGRAQPLFALLQRLRAARARHIGGAARAAPRARG